MANKEYGHFDEEMYQDGDNCQSFIGSFRGHILYYWHLANTYDILTKVLCVLDPSVTASNNSVPSMEGMMT